MITCFYKGVVHTMLILPQVSVLLFLLFFQRVLVEVKSWKYLEV